MDLRIGQNTQSLQNILDIQDHIEHEYILKITNLLDDLWYIFLQNIEFKETIMN